MHIARLEIKYRGTCATYYWSINKRSNFHPVLCNAESETFSNTGGNCLLRGREATGRITSRSTRSNYQPSPRSRGNQCFSQRKGMSCDTGRPSPACKQSRVLALVVPFGCSTSTIRKRSTAKAHISLLSLLQRLQPLSPSSGFPGRDTFVATHHNHSRCRASVRRGTWKWCQI